ncbi:MAG TPA: hypothetical protein VGI60_11925 [Chthoniobacterales bacterium]
MNSETRGPNVFAGYRNLPEQSAQAFTGDGWFRTGDLGYFDRDNFLHVTGRVSTLIKTESGEKFRPKMSSRRMRKNRPSAKSAYSRKAEISSP